MALFDYEPDPVRRARDHKLALLSSEAQQQRDMARRWLDIENTLRGSIDALAMDLDERRRLGKAISDQALYQMERYQTLLYQLQVEVQGFEEFADTSIRGRQLEFGVRAIDNSLELISTQRVALSFNRLPVEFVEHLVGWAGDGSPLSDLLKASWPDAADGMTAQLLRGTALGWNPRKTAEEMQRGMAGGLNRALNIARTEQLRVYRDVSREQYAESGVVRGYKRLCAKQANTCAACLMLDGKFYRLNEPMDEHPNGRCGQVPVVEGVKNVTWQTGRDWFYDQPESVQRDILGPGRYNAWQESKFDLQDLVTVRGNDTWGDSAQVASLKALVG